MSTTQSTDRGLGLALAFGVLAALGALYEFVASTDVQAGAGFAVAVAMAVLSVAAFHAFR